MSSLTREASKTMRIKRSITTAAIAILAVLGLSLAAPSVAQATVTAHTASASYVPLSCPDGNSRTYTDASVQPGVIVPDTSAEPYGPETYTPYTVEPGGQLQVIGPFNTIATADPLVAVWQSSTDCDGLAGSQNAWVTDASGSVFTESDESGPATQNFGDMGGHQLNAPMVGMTPTSDGQGYWEVAADGGVFAFGDAGFYGSMGGTHLNQPITGMAVTPDGGGYWLVAADGGIFAFGDAGFYGSMGGIHLNKPIEAMVPTPDGGGYWMVASDGGIFAFGDAAFDGSAGGMVLPSPIAGMVPNGSGYTLIAQDGSEYAFSGPPIATPPGPPQGVQVPNEIGVVDSTAINNLDSLFYVNSPAGGGYNNDCFAEEGFRVTAESPAPGTWVPPFSTVTLTCQGDD
jgi:hypothetical protein